MREVRQHAVPDTNQIGDVVRTFTYDALEQLSDSHQSPQETLREDALLLAQTFDDARAHRFELQSACVEALSLMMGRSFVAERDDLGKKAMKALVTELTLMPSDDTR